MAPLSIITRRENRQVAQEIIARWSRANVLVVADTIVSLGPEHHPDNLNEAYFGMGHLLSVLERVANVTKAHRTRDELDAPGVIENFQFTPDALKPYDQIWLLGFSTGNGLRREELEAVAAFMNAGGGVFATGDHAGLGSALAANLPRVRSMRLWRAPPSALGSDRVDTTMPDVNGGVVFENQSDDIPQVLRLKMYQWGLGRWHQENYPHPLLCSSDGPITEFPDHMHEGEVVLPEDLDAIFRVSDLSFDEYPRGADGKRLAPEIVAWGWTSGRASPEVMKGIHDGAHVPALPRWTGAVGVYDGHKVGVGRVVVDSTWHHFFDINLIGDNAANRPEFTDPRASLWRKGFTASPAGLRVLGKLDQYFSNIVHWLSPSKRYVRLSALVASIGASHKIREVMDTHDASALTLGAIAWHEALRLYPPCLIMELVFEPLREPLAFPFVPWEPPLGPDDTPIPPFPIPPKHLAQAALGGAVLALAEIESIDELNAHRGIERLREGIFQAVRSVIADEVESSRAALNRLESVLGTLNSATSA